jgi:hypothetical protein
MKSEWECMTIDELFALREEMQEILSAKLKAKKAELEHRLKMLNREPSNLQLAKSGPTGLIDN